jgi:hypothetical protein
MTTPENRLLPMSAVAAMLVVSSTIIGLAWWVGDAIGPGLAAIVAVSTRDDHAARQPVPTHLPARSEGAKSAKSVAAPPAKRDEAPVRR